MQVSCSVSSLAPCIHTYRHKHLTQAKTTAIWSKQTNPTFQPLTLVRAFFDLPASPWLHPVTLGAPRGRHVFSDQSLRLTADPFIMKISGPKWLVMRAPSWGDSRNVLPPWDITMAIHQQVLSNPSGPGSHWSLCVWGWSHIGFPWPQCLAFLMTYPLHAGTDLEGTIRSCPIKMSFQLRMSFNCILLAWIQSVTNVQYHGSGKFFFPRNVRTTGLLWASTMFLHADYLASFFPQCDHQSRFFWLCDHHNPGGRGGGWTGGGGREEEVTISIPCRTGSFHHEEVGLCSCNMCSSL